MKNRKLILLLILIVVGCSSNRTGLIVYDDEVTILRPGEMFLSRDGYHFFMPVDEHIRVIRRGILIVAIPIDSTGCPVIKMSDPAFHGK